MDSHLRVEIVPRIVPVGEEEEARRESAVAAALQSLNLERMSGSVPAIAAAQDAYSAAQADLAVDAVQDGYLVRLGGAEIPAVAYDLQVADSGAPLVSLVLAPDSLAIGDPPTAQQPPQAPPVAPQIASWGDGSIPDPRAGIPGWQPEKLADQVAGHAERVVLSNLPPMSWLRRFGGEGGSVAVTA